MRRDGIAPSNVEVANDPLGTGSGGIRVVVIEDDPIAQAYLRGVLDGAHIAVAAETRVGLDGLQAVVDELPDVALVDLGLPDIPGTELIRRIRLLAPAVEILVVTASEERTDLVESIAAGARGYVVKGVSDDDLVEAVGLVAQGEAVLSRRTIGRLVEFVRDRPVIAADEVAAVGETVRATLTEREIQILELLASGKENSEIAMELHLSSHTVKNHVRSILTKLHLENRVQAAVQAIRAGIA
jgi:two-component system, NarL family, nitrate/nitrite response regulator NarL